MPEYLNRRQLMQAAAGGSLAAVALSPGQALLAEQNTNPTPPRVPGVDMSHECTVEDPEHYHLEFENEFVRVIRCRIPARDKVKMHNHPLGSVIIFMTDQNLHQTLEIGKTEEAHNKAGHVLWANGSQSQHMGENVTDQMYEYLRVDVKAAVPTRA
jgi:quercetin dioxygenase-like cupin family protein